MSSWKTTGTLITAFVLALSITALADTIADEISVLAKSSDDSWQNFWTEAEFFPLRHEYSGEISPDKHEKFQSICDDAILRLSHVHTRQADISEQIRTYEGEDWEQKFGVTSLWQKIKADICETKLRTAEVNYYKS